MSSRERRSTGKKSSSAVAFVVSWAIFGSSAVAQQTGSIQGTTVDLKGRPVQGLEVYAFQPDRPAEQTGTRANSGKEGAFTLASVPPGAYQVIAFSEAQGYANPLYYFYDGLYPPPRVQVRAGEVTDSVVVRVGPKGAWVAGKVVDAVSGRHLTDAGLIFYRADSAQDFFRSGLNTLLWDRHARDLSFFKVLVPSGRPFRFKVQAPGYDAWYYGPDGTESHAQPIVLTPGETKEVIIPLHRLSRK